jgi:hypothetical protein
MTFYLRAIALGLLLAFPMILFQTTSFSHEPGGKFPVPMIWSETANSVYDLSAFLDAPAGKDGYIRVEGEHFVKPDGTRFRMWGVNLMANFFFMPKEHAAKVAEDFARFGFTCVRFHSIDAGGGGALFSNPRNTWDWDAEKLDRLDYFVSELKKRGVYFSMTINAYRVFREDDGIVDGNKIGFGKTTYYTNPDVQKRCFEYAEKFLTHKNPYTGNEYRNEPAMIWIELLNENSLVEAWANRRLIGLENDTRSQQAWRNWTPYYADELEETWNQWLKEHVSQEKRKQWAAALGRDSDRVPTSTPADWTMKCSDEHFAAELRFMMETESRLYRNMVDFLKKLEVKSLITGDADHNHWFSPYPHLMAFNWDGDFIDSHAYWEHPDFGPPARLAKQNPMVNDPLGSTVVQISRTPVAGKPFTTTELNSVFPHPYAGEHTPIFTAYSLLQDWDGIIWFNWGNGQLATLSARPEMFASGNDPIRFSNLILAGLMFHRGDVEKAKETVVRTLTRSEAMDSLRWDRAQHRPVFTKGFSPSTSLQHTVRLKILDDGTSEKPDYPPPAPLGLIRSDTGQLAWKNADKQEGVVTMDTAWTQGAVGFLGGTQESFNDVEITVQNEFATVVLTSLDGKPIRESRRMLLVAHSYYQSTGFAWEEDGRTIKQMGTLPMEILPVQGAVTLKNRNSAGKVTIRSLSGVGVPNGSPQNLMKEGNLWKATLPGESSAVWYLIEIHDQP